MPTKPRESRLAKGLWWDEAWSLVHGCSPVSEGCRHCWAAQASHMRASNPNPAIAARNAGRTEMGPNGPRFNGTVRPDWDALEKPRRRRKPTMYAVWNDLFHRDVPEEFIDSALVVASLCKQHTFLMLTKRADRMQAHIDGLFTFPLPNVWLGVTAENQQAADERIPLLLETPAAVRFVSCEPLLEEVNLVSGEWVTACPRIAWLHGSVGMVSGKTLVRETPGIDWVIVGGETGPGARPMRPAWACDIRNQAVEADVAFFFKSWGAHVPAGQDRYTLDGRTWHQFPEGEG